jgi:hypothetical protein
LGGARDRCDHQGEERQNSALRFRDGATVTLTEATIGYDDRTVSENATEYGDLADRHRLVRDTAPLATIALGLSVLAGGLVIRRSGTGRPGRGRIRSRLRRRVRTASLAEGVEDSNDAGIHPVSASVPHRHRLGEPLGLVVDTARSHRVDVSPVRLLS